MLGGGARAVSMGGAYTAVANDVTAISWNPAGLAQVQQTSVLASYASRHDDSAFAYVATAVPVGHFVLGASVSSMDYGSYVIRDTSGNNKGSERLVDVSGAISLAGDNPAWLPVKGVVGAAFEVTREETGGSFVSVSLGGKTDVLDPVTLGWVIQHLGFEVDGFGPPSVGKIGLMFPLNSMIQVATDVSYPFSSKIMSLSVGAELIPYSTILLRVGYKREINPGVLGSPDGLALGGGLRMEHWGFDYAYQPLEDFGNGHRVAISYYLGASRDELSVHEDQEAISAASSKASVELKEDISKEFSLSAKGKHVVAGFEPSETIYVYPHAGGIAKVNVEIKKPSVLMVSLYDFEGRFIKHIVERVHVPKGDVGVIWDGTLLSGERAKFETPYVLGIQFGQSVRYVGVVFKEDNEQGIPVP